MGNNIEQLKIVYAVARQVLGVDLSDKDMSKVLSFRYIADNIRHDRKSNALSIAVVFDEFAFLGILTSAGRFENNIALPYKKETIQKMKQCAIEIFGASEISDAAQELSSITWRSPQVFGLKHLPNGKPLSPFELTDNKEEKITEEVLSGMMSDWNGYIVGKELNLRESDK